MLKSKELTIFVDLILHFFLFKWHLKLCTNSWAAFPAAGKCSSHHPSMFCCHLLPVHVWHVCTHSSDFNLLLPTQLLKSHHANKLVQGRHQGSPLPSHTTFLSLTFILIPSCYFIPHFAYVQPLFDSTAPWYGIFYYKQSWNESLQLIIICFSPTWCHTLPRFCVTHQTSLLSSMVTQQEPLLLC